MGQEPRDHWVHSYHVASLHLNQYLFYVTVNHLCNIHFQVYLYCYMTSAVLVRCKPTTATTNDSEKAPKIHAFNMSFLGLLVTNDSQK